MTNAIITLPFGPDLGPNETLHVSMPEKVPGAIPGDLYITVEDEDGLEVFCSCVPISVQHSKFP